MFLIRCDGRFRPHDDLPFGNEGRLKEAGEKDGDAEPRRN
jgi:hypothetical protein